MTKVIIYKNDLGGVSVVYPTSEALEILLIDEIAKKDVPTGAAYKIIDVSELPDRALRDAWEIDAAILTDGVGA